MEAYTQTDLAKYPFIKEAAERVKKLDLTITDIAKPELRPILRRSQERIENAIRYTHIGQRRSDNLVEIVSYPVAVVIVIATKNDCVKKRYALSEAKQAYRELQMEPNEKLEVVARDFGWNLTLNQDNAIPLDFALNFADFLRNITHLQDTKWKLINRILAHGKVYLSKHEVARLLQEEVQRRIQKRLDTPEQPFFPAEVLAVAERINALAKEMVSESRAETFPEHISQSAFPPCILALYDAATKGKHLSHMGRFTLTSFLVTIGIPSEKVAEAFKILSDYDARLTCYQVKHIAGDGGAGTRYKPPRCSTLQTHDVCSGKNGLCLKIRHPLAYYRHKLKSLEPKPRLEAS